MRSRLIEMRTSVGILNLPIYVPALAFILDISYDMNRELLGQGVANIFAGMLGTVPSTPSTSHAPKAAASSSPSSAFSPPLFLCAGLLLPYVSTILACALVMFLGIKLFPEAIWEVSKTLAWMDYVIVLATLGACTCLGFAEGFGVGIGAAAVPARVTRWNEWNELQQLRTKYQDHVAVPMEGCLPPRNHTLQSHSTAPRNNLSPSTDLKTSDDVDFLQQINARAFILSGYVFFASIPSLERALLTSLVSVHFFILDLTHGHSIETAAARVFLHCVRELKLKTAYLSCAASV
ncbi:hypothetical protein B0H14DRAFT_3483796 [Mycena olivaceomarginata]|nr:hypothetical protein B0H14DRAFT_3483796 [Mycena olivaceomarginata]